MDGGGGRMLKWLSHMGAGEDEGLCVRALPANGVKVFLQVSCVDVGLAELQLSSRIVVNVVNTHFLHDAKTSLKRRRGFGRRWRGRYIAERAGAGRWKDYEKDGGRLEKATLEVRLYGNILAERSSPL